jgi:hypothetical protein
MQNSDWRREAPKGGAIIWSGETPMALQTPYRRSEAPTGGPIS